MSELVGSEVVTESGDKLDRVWEVRAVREPEGLRLVGLLVGRAALLERLGFRHWVGGGEADEGVRPENEAIPWEAVVRLEEGLVVVKDGTRPKEL